MANENCRTNPDDGKLRRRKLKRNNYFDGKRLDVEDFNTEQNYLIQKVRRLGAHIFGAGVIEGLKIEKIEPAKRALTLAAGSAVDGSGNLLVVLKKRVFNLERDIVPGDYIYLEYTEEGRDKVGKEGEEDCSDDCCFDRIEEDVKITLDKSLDNLEPADICGEKHLFIPRFPRKPIVVSKRDAGPNKARVLLGRYRRDGGVDYSDVVPLHKNSELSRLLCKISAMYVRSLNGQSGDLFAVSSINEAKPDDNGHMELEGGNNISVESEGNRITISSKSGLYARYFKTINADDFVVISHGLRSFPSVDIYLRVKAYIENKPVFEAISRRELYKMAKDSMMEFGELEKELEAKDFESFMEEYNDKFKSARRKSVSPRSKMGTAEALSMYGVTELSSKIHKAADIEIGKIKRDIYIIPRYYYEKIVGSGNQNLSLLVTHTSMNTLKIKNLGDKSVSVMVVLNA